MRAIKTHIINPANDRLDVFAVDEPGAGGAHHEYTIGPKDAAGHDFARISFQNGPINEAGVNGVTQEALLAVVIDRLRCFQSGPFSCRENALALTKCEEALQWLQARTRDRMERGAEGKSVA